MFGYCPVLLICRSECHRSKWDTQISPRLNGGGVGVGVSVGVSVGVGGDEEILEILKRFRVETGKWERGSEVLVNLEMCIPTTS